MQLDQVKISLSGKPEQKFIQYNISRLSISTVLVEVCTHNGIIKFFLKNSSQHVEDSSDSSKLWSRERPIESYNPHDTVIRLHDFHESRLVLNGLCSFLHVFLLLSFLSRTSKLRVKQFARSGCEAEKLTHGQAVASGYKWWSICTHSLSLRFS